jgi:hypothetical protein
MMIKKEYSLLVLLITLLLVACRSEESSGCLPPKGFSESDLVGTWDAPGERGDSTIIISGDGRYKQIMNIQRTGFK